MSDHIERVPGIRPLIPHRPVLWHVPQKRIQSRGRTFKQRYHLRQSIFHFTLPASSNTDAGIPPIFKLAFFSDSTQTKWKGFLSQSSVLSSRAKSRDLVFQPAQTSSQSVLFSDKNVGRILSRKSFIRSETK